MTAPSLLLTQLRRSRFGWWLCALVLVLKMVSGTACLADGTRGAATEATVVTHIVGAAVSVDNTTEGCVLGEGADCHCACAHAVPMVFAAADDAFHLAGPFDAPASSSGFIAPFTGSLLRPPIA